MTREVSLTWQVHQMSSVFQLWLLPEKQPHNKIQIKSKLN